MDNQDTSRTVEDDPADCRYLLAWMAEAGVTVDSIETRPVHTCPAHRPVDLHVAA